MKVDDFFSNVLLRRLLNFSILIVSICLVGILVVDLCWYNTFDHLGFLRFVLIFILVVNIVRLKLKYTERGALILFNIVIIFISIYNILWLGVIPFGYSYNGHEMTVSVETLLFFNFMIFVLAIADWVLEVRTQTKPKID